MIHKLKRAVAIGRQRTFAFAPNKNYIFNGAINVLASDSELILWKAIKKNSPFFSNETDTTLQKFNTNTTVIFDFYDKRYSRELAVEATGEYICFSESDNSFYLKSRSKTVEKISQFEYEVWRLIHNKTNLYNIYAFLMDKYDSKLADHFMFYSLPNLQAAQLLDIFCEPSVVFS